MSYRIASFNIQKFSLKAAMNSGKKDLEKIAQIIRDNSIDILAIQEILHPEALQKLLEAIDGITTSIMPANTSTRTNQVAGFKTKHWEGRWAAPMPTYGHGSAEGYAFIWNTTRIQLVTNYKNKVFEPRIETYTIRNFLNVEDDFSESHKKIKERIKAHQLLSNGARHSKLLLSGEHEFYRYVKRSKLDEAQVIAVINDNSAMDCDLIFTENGLVVRERQSGFAVGAKYALLGPLALIDDGVHAILPHEVAYNEAEYKDNQLQKPRYKNNDVNMDELFQLIEEIRGACVDNSIEHRISSAILNVNTES